MNRLSTGFKILPGLEANDLNMGVFVPAASSLIFGKGTGAAAAGIGTLLLDLEGLIDGSGSTIHMGTILNAFSLFAGAWITGFLGKRTNTVPETFKGVIGSREQIKELISDTIASIIGMSLLSSFIYSFGSQFQEGASINGGVTMFLERFMKDAFVIIIFVPLTLIFFDGMLVFNQKRDKVIDELLRKIDVVVTKHSGSEIVSVELTERALTIGVWAPIKLKFKNAREEPTRFSIEAVSTSRIYPHIDKTPVLDPGELWTQTYYALPAKQETVSVRMRITPDAPQIFKQVAEEETVVEFTAKTRTRAGLTKMLAGFSGVNFGVLGLSAIWEQFMVIIGEPSIIIDELKTLWDVAGLIAIIEAIVFVPLIYYIYRSEKMKKDEDKLVLGFSSDLEDQEYTAIIKKRYEEFLERYKDQIATISKVVVILTSVASVGYLGYEGYQIFTDSTYETENPELIFGLAAGLLLVWIGGMGGMATMSKLGLALPGSMLQKGNVILKFEPMGTFQKGVPTQVRVLAHNPTALPGIRIVFEGFDTISPPQVELHLESDETAQFKIAVTPQKSETQDILAFAYPLFNENKEYFDFDSVEPFAMQEVSYEVMGQTAMGISKQQQSTLKKIGGAGIAMGVALTFAGQFMAIPSVIDQLKDGAPQLAAAQAPFIYAYFNLTNRFRKSEE